jgi:CRP-like cAMP-binding protein
MSPASISGLPLFAGLSPVEAAELESRMRRREYAPQQTIVREGGAGDAAFLIVSGLVAVRHKDADSGVDFLLAELGPGQMFGEMALITGKPRTASVTAIEQTSCAVLERADFERALQ